MKAAKFLSGLIICMIAGVVFAQGVPQLINYQGRLTDDTGLPLDGPVEMRFRLLDADTLSASVLWSETQSSVSVSQGIYHVLLGSVNPLPPSAMSQADIFLEVRVAGEILRPRSQITSVAFAHKAASVPDSSITSAMIADGTITGDDITTDTITSTHVQDDSLGSADIQDIYVLNTGDTVSGDLQVNGNQTIGLDLTVTGGNIGVGTGANSEYGIINDPGSAPIYGANFYGSKYGIVGAWSPDPADHYVQVGAQDYGIFAQAGSNDEAGYRFGGQFYAYSQEFSYGIYTQAYGFGVNETYGVFANSLNAGSGDAYGGFFISSGAGTGYGIWASADDYAGWFDEGKVHVGSSGTEDYVDGSGDLYVMDELEVDGEANFSGGLEAPGAIDPSDVSFNYAGSSIQGGAATLALDLNCFDCVTSSNIADGAVMAVNIGEDCAVGDALIRTPSGWECSTPWYSNMWTWMSGNNTINQNGVYGTKGVTNPANFPGARDNAVSWTDSAGRLWLFGGEGYPASGTYGRLNDLWRYDGANWTWMSGDTVINQNGVYGTRGTPDPANFPGSRFGSVSWKDSSDNFWLFGGYGNPATGSNGYLNDLWRWDGANWTWMSGDTVTGQYGVYGTKGTPDPGNFPGCRRDGVSWTDSSGNLWMFGGVGLGASGGFGNLNDLWRWDGANWTWMSGDTVTGQYGVYGTKGTPDPANVPGARYRSVSWIDTSDNLWLFGGNGRAESSGGDLNDLWRFDGANWTWMSGDTGINQYGVYGTKGIPDPANVPGSRYESISWIDSAGDFWLFGGYGYPASGLAGWLNDLWRWDGANWTWMSGSDVRNQNGVYGMKYMPAPSNVPGSRQYSISWIDSSGRMWLFGGDGFPGSGGSGRLNDLWRYTPPL